MSDDEKAQLAKALEARMDALPIAQYLVIETLAARYRLGEHLWTFPRRTMPTLKNVAASGLVAWKRGVVEDSCLAWLTEDGRIAALSDTYRSPIDTEIRRLTAELALKDQALDEIKEQARRWLKIASTAGGPEDVAYNEGLRDCQGDIQRILTRLDTQGETK